MNFHNVTGKVHFILIIMTGMMPNITSGQIYNLAELSSAQFDALDRESTVILMPMGILEEHGPHLPLFTDGYISEWLTQRLAEEIVHQRDRQVVIFPTIPIGVGEPEEFAPRKRFPGSYAVSPSTQRAVLMDMATGLGEDGFKWVFVMSFHGPRLQSLSIEQVCEYFKEIYGSTMVNFKSAIHPNPPSKEDSIAEEKEKANGMEVHAGLYESSQILFLRPNLVHPDFKNLQTYPINNLEDLKRYSQDKDWPGYFGAPNLAAADIGANSMKVWSENINDLAIKILDGLDPTTLSSTTDSQNPALLQLDEEILKLEKKYLDQQNSWLESKGYK